MCAQTLLATSILAFISIAAASTPTEECKYFDLSTPLTLNFSPNVTMQFPLGGSTPSDMYHQSQTLYENKVLGRSISISKIDSPQENKGRYIVTESVLEDHIRDPTTLLSPVVIVIYLTNGEVGYFYTPRVRHMIEYSCYVPYDGIKTTSHIDISASREPKMPECFIDVNTPSKDAKWSNDQGISLKTPVLAHAGTSKQASMREGSLALPDRKLNLYYNLYEHPSKHAVPYLYETNLELQQGKLMSNAQVKLKWENGEAFNIPLPAYRGGQYQCYYIFEYFHLQIDRAALSYVT